jgi:hypothetical protein
MKSIKITKVKDYAGKGFHICDDSNNRAYKNNVMGESIYQTVLVEIFAMQMECSRLGMILKLSVGVGIVGWLRFDVVCLGCSGVPCTEQSVDENPN